MSRRVSSSVSLDQLQIREPCHEAWDAMHVEGTGRRHCGSCVKSVHDFSVMSRVEVERLLSQPGELPCVRFARGGDGRVLTRDDFARQPVPMRRPWLRRAAAIAATLGFGSLFNVGCERRPQEPVLGTMIPTTAPIYPGQAVMGDVEPMTEPPATLGKVAPTMGEATARPTTEPTTRPVDDPNVTGHTVGVISMSPPPPKIYASAPPAKTKAATHMRGRPS